MNVYDVDGNAIESMEESTLELTNTQLNLEKQITEELISVYSPSNNLQTQSVSIMDSEAEKIICNLEAGVLSVATCTVTGPAAIACTVGVGALMSYFWCPYDENAVANSPIPDID